jgi:hypothetical protein
MDWRCLFKLRLFSVERDRLKGKVCVGNLLTGVFLVNAIFVDHRRPSVTFTWTATNQSSVRFSLK